MLRKRLFPFDLCVDADCIQYGDVKCIPLNNLVDCRPRYRLAINTVNGRMCCRAINRGMWISGSWWN